MDLGKLLVFFAADTEMMMNYLVLNSDQSLMVCLKTTVNKSLVRLKETIMEMLNTTSKQDGE